MNQRNIFRMFLLKKKQQKKQKLIKNTNNHIFSISKHYFTSFIFIGKLVKEKKLFLSL